MSGVVNEMQKDGDGGFVFRMPSEEERKEVEEERVRTKSAGSGEEVEEEEHDPYFEPIINLPLVEVKTMEEEEEELWSGRAKLYRYDDEPDPKYNVTGEAMWKERGTGTVRILSNPTNGCVRLVMRREQTLKLCANHYIYPDMELKEHSRSQNTWLWTTPADYSEMEPSPQVLAIRFKTTDAAQAFRETFNQAKVSIQEDEKKKEEEEGSGDADHKIKEKDVQDLSSGLKNVKVE